MKLPHFIQGIHYGRNPRSGWEYILLRDITVPLAEVLELPDVQFYDATGIPWARIIDDQLTIRKGYAWNGNSFAIDTRANMLGSLVHDVLYQFSAAPGFPMERDQADLIYLGILRGSGFKLSRLYYHAVRRFGAVFWNQGLGERMELI
jgi:hypothetical protein